MGRGNVDFFWLRFHASFCNLLIINVSKNGAWPRPAGATVAMLGFLSRCLTKTHFPWFGWIRSRWSRIPCHATGNLTGGGGESWRRYAPAWLFRPRRLYGNGIPDGALTKKARCLSTASFLLTRDSVGIRTQDPQLRRLLLYPAELPNHPYVSTRRLPFREEQVCKYRDFLFNGNVSRRKFLQILYAGHSRV